MRFFKGDTIRILCYISEDISDWKIRASITDEDGNSVKIASENSGGSSSQVIVNSGSSDSNFILNFASGLTAYFNSSSTLEIEVDTGEVVNGQPEIYTLRQEDITLVDQKIPWTTP